MAEQQVTDDNVTRGRNPVVSLDDAILPAAFAFIAVLYASLGQAGGTGYVAAMGLLALDPAVIKPTALALNILVAAIGCFRFFRAGLLTWRGIYPFAVLGIPLSFLGGAIQLPATIYHPAVGSLLLLAGAQMLRSAWGTQSIEIPAERGPPLLPAVIAGGLVGLVSGITGVGGGIFLAPLLLTLGWAGMRQTSAISAAFNFLNSSAGFAGVWATMPGLPVHLPIWMIAVVSGGLIGSWLGAYFLPPRALKALLAALLLGAAGRMILS